MSRRQGLILSLPPQAGHDAEIAKKKGAFTKNQSNCQDLHCGRNNMVLLSTGPLFLYLLLCGVTRDQVLGIPLARAPW